MTLKKSNFINILIISLLISGCQWTDKARKLKLPLPISTNLGKQPKEKKAVTIKCKKGDIKDYLEKGWRIKSSEKREVTCTWKVQAANKGCNIEKDKGCRITVPDKEGIEIKYFLEK